MSNVLLEELFSAMVSAYHEAQRDGCDQNAAYDCLVEAGTDFIKLHPDNSVSRAAIDVERAYSHWWKDQNSDDAHSRLTAAMLRLRAALRNAACSP